MFISNLLHQQEFFMLNICIHFSLYVILISKLKICKHLFCDINSYRFIDTEKVLQLCFSLSGTFKTKS